MKVFGKTCEKMAESELENQKKYLLTNEHYLHKSI